MIKEIFQTEAIQDILRYFRDDLPSLSNGIVSVSEFSNKIASNGHFCTLEDNGVLKGFAAYYDNDTQTSTAYLSMLAVKSDHRHEHIGTKLLGFVETESAKRGMKFLKLEVSKNNLVGIKFYTVLGYKQCGEKELSWYYIKELDAYAAG